MNSLVERSHGHSIRGGKHRQTDIRTGKSHGTGNRLVVIHHQRGSHRLPVIRHQSNCRFVTHNLFRLCSQLSQHGWIRTREHQLDRVLLVHQIITFHPHVSIRVMSCQVILNLGHRRFQLFRGRVIHDQLPVTHRGFRDRTHQIITGRRPADTRRHMSHLRAAQQIILYTCQIRFYPFHPRTFRHLKFNIQLRVTQIREETLWDIPVQKCGNRQ